MSTLRTFAYEGTPFVGQTDEYQDFVRVYDTGQEDEPLVFHSSDERDSDPFAAAESWVAQEMNERRCTKFVFVPDRGERVYFYACDTPDAQRLAAELFHRIPGAIFGPFIRRNANGNV